MGRSESAKILQSRIQRELRISREKKRETQAEAAEALNMSLEFYGRLERGHALPSLVTFWAIVRQGRARPSILFDLLFEGDSC